MEKGRIVYSLADLFVVVKLYKKMTWEVGVELKTLLEYIFNNIKISTIYFDLSETSYIDSTILGVLVQARKSSEDHNIHMTISSPTKECEAILTDIGLNKIIEITKKSPPETDNINELPLGERNTPAEIGQLIKDVHKGLMELNDKNKSLFLPVVETFNKDKKT